LCPKDISGKYKKYKKSSHKYNRKYKIFQNNFKTLTKFALV